MNLTRPRNLILLAALLLAVGGLTLVVLSVTAKDREPNAPFAPTPIFEASRHIENTCVREGPALSPAELRAGRHDVDVLLIALHTYGEKKLTFDDSDPPTTIRLVLTDLASEMRTSPCAPLAARIRAGLR